MKASTLFELALTAGIFLLKKTPAAGISVMQESASPVSSGGSDFLSSVLTQANHAEMTPPTSPNPISAPMVVAMQTAAAQGAAQALTYQQQAQVINAANVAAGMEAGMVLRAAAEAAARAAK